MTNIYQKAYRGIKNDIINTSEYVEDDGTIYYGDQYLEFYHISADMLDQILYQLDCENYIEMGAKHSYFIVYKPYTKKRRELFFVTKFADNQIFKNYYANTFTHGYTPDYDEQCHINDKFDLVLLNKTDFQKIALSRLQKSAGVIYQTESFEVDNENITKLRDKKINFILLDDKNIFANKIPNTLIFKKASINVHEILNSKSNFVLLLDKDYDKHHQTARNAFIVRYPNELPSLSQCLYNSLEMFWIS